MPDPAPDVVVDASSAEDKDDDSIPIEESVEALTSDVVVVNVEEMAAISSLSSSSS